MPTLPLTQLDERALAADLDNRTFTLTFAQPVPINDLLLLLVRGTIAEHRPRPRRSSGSFIGELKNVTVRQALESDPAAARPRLPRRRRLHPRRSRASPRRASSTSTTSRPNGRLHRRSAAPVDAGVSARSSTTRTDVFADSRTACRRCCPGRDVQRRSQGRAVQVTDFPERLDRVGAVPRSRPGPRPPPGADRRADRRGRVERRERRHRLACDWPPPSPPRRRRGSASPGGPDRAARDRSAQLLRLLAAQGKVATIASPRC